MHNRRRLIPVVVILVAAAVMIWFLSSRSAEASSRQTATGTVEATQVRVSAEVGGRVTAVLAAEGDPVQAGDPLVQLDASLLRAQRAQVEEALAAARAGLQAAQANLDLLLAGASAEQIAVAQAAVAAARVTADGAQDIYAALPEAAQETVDGKKLKLQADQAAAALATAEAQLALTQAGARREQIAAAQAQVDAATAQVAVQEAALQLLDVQLGKLTIVAPLTGTLITRAIEPGEVASPAATLLVIADLEHLTVTVYVPEDRYGKINLGDRFSVQADSFPEETFSGVVVAIADQFEFTPRNVQTVENRKGTVFAIKLALAPSGGKLKPGMPVEVELVDEEIVE